ncbi:hypothetical protein E1211_27205 [Micromonospora sp. 15K316]|uniref:hypothetical protein n=1 Tax=Micromonospora sp. 15K316 TaxID=2530376 RepID=UPI001048FCAA|nr:hypothetical protein [Micromonospora sp. 15K316]TDC28808.1 hypothetical protein E1211_27205 [Micromonospora sp. 15K316]
MWDRLVLWWWLDHLVVVAIAGFLALKVAPGSGLDALGRLNLADRRSVYTDLLQLTALFAGFGGVIFTIFIGLRSAKELMAKSRFGTDLLRVWLAALITPWVSAFAMVLAKVLDRGGVGSTNEARWLVVGATVLVAFQLLRIVWVFYQIAHIEMAPPMGPAIPQAQAPAVVKRRHARREASDVESQLPM